MITYGLNIENQNLINKKAKSKCNGIFKFRGVAYKVVNNRVIAMAYDGEILEQFGAFNVKIGSYAIGNENPADALKRIKR